MSSERAHGPGGPYIAHLERLCQLIERGQTFAVELHPYGDAPAELRGRLIRRARLEILAGGDVTVLLPDGQTRLFIGLTLANYKARWRVWVNGIPQDAARRATAWRV